jgi:hypothetical protein
MSVCSSEKLIVGTFKMILDGFDLGTTTGGVTISQNNEYTEVRNDQSNTLQAIFRTQQDFTVSATMRDQTLDKLRVIYGVKRGVDTAGAGYNGSNVLCIGSDGACSFPEEYALTIQGPGPGCGCRNFHFPRVVMTPSSVEYLIQRENPVEVQVEFRVLPSCPDGMIGCISDTCDMYHLKANGSGSTLTVSNSPIPHSPVSPPGGIGDTTTTPEE